MTGPRIRLSRGRRWLVGGALVACAGLISMITPSDDALLEPFLVRGGADGATGRTLSAQVLSASFAHTLISDHGDWEEEGNWLVVQLAASSPRTEEDAEIGFATLHVDGRVFEASERVPDTLRTTGLHVGTDTVGFLAFELADDIDAGEAELRLTTFYRTPGLDDVLAIRVPLDDAVHESRAEITEPEIVASEDAP